MAENVTLVDRRTQQEEEVSVKLLKSPHLLLNSVGRHKEFYSLIRFLADIGEEGLCQSVCACVCKEGSVYLR